MTADRDIRLTPTSFIVLGLVAAAGQPVTPYDLKRIHAVGVGNFWKLNHAQIYAEPDRLAAAGYLSIEQEKGGRRRKQYELTAAGRKALDDWLATPTSEFTELHDAGLLQLFFGADPAALAEVQLPIHEQRLRDYEELHAGAGAWPAGPRLALESGIGHEREWVRFWRGLARNEWQPPVYQPLCEPAPLWPSSPFPLCSSPRTGSKPPSTEMS